VPEVSFGHGERAELARSDVEAMVAGHRRALKLTDGQYACILQKVFHTFLYDLREFAVDYFDVGSERFLSALPWLTFFQTIIYELDLIAEGALASDRPIPAEEIAERGEELRSFLRSNRLSDPETEAALEQVIHYLSHEAEHRKTDHAVDVNQVLELLDWKTADLEILLRLVLRLCEIQAAPHELHIFRLLERVREVFDDIRDYHEDAATRSFNVVGNLEKLLGRGKAHRTIVEYVEQEYAQIDRLIEQEEGERRARFALLTPRWRDERRHYLGELDALWTCN